MAGRMYERGGRERRDEFVSVLCYLDVALP
jgi:hypothetical protein